MGYLGVGFNGFSGQVIRGRPIYFFQVPLQGGGDLGVLRRVGSYQYRKMVAVAKVGVCSLREG